MDFCTPWISAGWSDAADIATVGGVLAIPIALFVYRENARATRLSHMHRLFTDYLQMAFEHSMAGKRNAESRAQLVSFRMYTMEEMLLWIERERRTFGPWAVKQLSVAAQLLRIPPFESKYQKALNSWDRTVASHLTSRFEEKDEGTVAETVANLDKYRACYTDWFAQYVDSLDEVVAYREWSQSNEPEPPAKPK
jgi:hypothetical protein